MSRNMHNLGCCSTSAGIIQRICVVFKNMVQLFTSRLRRTDLGDIFKIHHFYISQIYPENVRKKQHRLPG